MIKKHKRTMSTHELHTVLKMNQFPSDARGKDEKIYLFQGATHNQDYNIQNQINSNIDQLVKQSTRKFNKKIVLVERIDYLQEAKERQLFNFGRGLKNNTFQMDQHQNLSVSKKNNNYDQNLFKIPETGTKKSNNKNKLKKNRKKYNNSHCSNKINLKDTIISRKISSTFEKQYFSSHPKEAPKKKNTNNLLLKKQINIKKSKEKSLGALLTTRTTSKQSNFQKKKKSPKK